MALSRHGLLLGSSLLGIAAVTATPALAQTSPAQPTAPVENEGQEIVVTGSLITNPNLKQATPVMVTTADEIDLKQSNTAENVLRELPGVVPNIGSSVNNGNGGASLVDLRGLGSNRNIVLLNGDRITPSNFFGRVDLNNIPLALVERLDLQTGAAVTTYGADAITGVVNFITRRNFSGFDLQASKQITEQGDGSVSRVDATIGGNFEDGRGNATLSVGYQKADPVYQGDRDFSFFQIDSRSGAQSGSGTSVPSRFSGTRPLDPLTGQPSTIPTVGNNNLRQINPATGFAEQSLFAPFNFNPYNIFQTPFERFNIFGQAHYEVADNIEVYGRGLFSKNRVGTIVAPSGSFGELVTINLNNPFLQAGLRSQFCAFNVAPAPGTPGGPPAGSPQTTYTPRFTPAQCAAAATATGASDPNYRTVTVTLNRRATEIGPRKSTFQTTIFDYRIGARGALTSTLKWDVNGSYGESENTQAISNYVQTSRLRQGLLVNGTAANPVCQDTANGCVPVNVFGNDGSISPAAATFLNASSSSTNRTSLAQARATITGDLGRSLPWATNPVGIAVGAEYRKYTAQQTADALSRTAGELGGLGGATPLVDGGYSVYEGFGEIIAPIVEDRPFFKSLTIEGGIRYSSYTVDAPGKPGYNTLTYKAGASWEPVDGLKFRGNYSRAVRAPNIGELFIPLSVGLTNLAVDPCAGVAPTTNANLRAICLAQGAPAGTIGAITNPTSAQANINAGGNPNLQPEKANTYTVGAVIQPDFLRGFDISIDYYNIKVKDTIGAPLPGDLIAACFGSVTSASAADPACTVIRRNPTTGGLDGSPATTPGLFARFDNLGRLSTDGVDLVANYKTDLGFAKLGLSFVGNWTHSTKFQASPTALNRECAGFYSVNCGPSPGVAGGSIQPKFQFSQRTTLSVGDVDVSLLWRWLDAVQFEPQQFQDDLAAAVAAGTDPARGCPDPTGTDPNGCIVDPAFRRIGARSYFDLSTRYRIGEHFTFVLTVQNLLDKKPPILGNTIGTNSFNSGNTYPSTYDALGRRFAVSARVTF
jgi:iron complex outermembrane recepter protein